MGKLEDIESDLSTLKTAVDKLTHEEARASVRKAVFMEGTGLLGRVREIENALDLPHEAPLRVSMTGACTSSIASLSPRRAGCSWDRCEDRALWRSFRTFCSNAGIYRERSIGAIISRIKHLLETGYGGE